MTCFNKRLCRCLLVLFISLATTVNAQDITNNGFYQSFMKHLKLTNRASYQGRLVFHSIKMTTNSEGVINHYEAGNSIDTMLKDDIAKAFLGADKHGLKSYKFKNKSLILPIVIVTAQVHPINYSMWDFPSDKTDKFSKEVYLPPFVYFCSPEKPINN